MKTLTDTLELVVRLISGIVLFGISAFCVFGFLESFEPGNGVLWRIGYGTFGCGSVSGAMALAAWGGKHKLRTIIAGSGLFLLAALLLFLYADVR